MPDSDRAPLSFAEHTALLARIEAAVATVVRGNPHAVRLVLAGLLARGHVLLEDVPGVGKTTLARTLARVLGCSFGRVQFTSDLLPSDIIGVQVLDGGHLRFKRGPLFAQVVLADEINRASPKTQSALLEAMSDGQVSVDDETHLLPRPFLVIATQNPVEHHGTYPLPESQLDRFAVHTALGYPPADDERALLLGRGADVHSAAVLTDAAGVRALQEAAQATTLSDAVADYLLALVQATRRHADVELGCSPRGALAFAAVARAYALLCGRDHVLPDDVKATAPAVLGHRLALRGAPGADARRSALALVATLLQQTPAPR